MKSPGDHTSSPAGLTATARGYSNAEMQTSSPGPRAVAFCLAVWFAGAITTPSAARAEQPIVLPPQVPSALAVPADAKVVARFHATGAQVYVCSLPKQPAPATAAPPAAGYAWILQRPDATLHDAAGAVAGKHGAGPSWTSNDGSSVTAQKVAQANAPLAGAVPWLLLRATSTSGHGVFHAVTFVQRVATKGGKAPDHGCDAKSAGTETRADYSADYYFFTGAAPAAAPSAGAAGHGG